MKVKLLRRVFCVVMCVVILACSSVNVLGAELFYDEYSYRWNNRSPDVTIYWINGNIPNGSSGITSADLLTGMNTWVSGTRDTVLSAYTDRLIVSVVATQITAASYPSSGGMIHSIPQWDYWKALFSSSGDYFIASGLTMSYTVTGYAVTEGTAGYHPVCGQEIAHSNIYYNPNHDGPNYETEVDYFGANHNWANTVAHEIGHALGFGHEGSSGSIMYNSNTSVLMLSNIDRANYINKYCLAVPQEDEVE